MATQIPIPPAGAMGAEPIKHRYASVSSVVVNTVLATCDVIDITELEAIAVQPSAGINSLTVHASESVGGTFVIVDSIGTAGAVTVVASKWNVLDVTKIKPFGYIKLLPNTNGTAIIVGKT